MQNKKKTKKTKIVRKPYQRGALLDAGSFKQALKVAGTLLMTYFIYLVVGAMLVWNSLFLRLLTNGVMVLLGCGLLYANGLNVGVADVTFGEIIYQRREEGKPVSAADVKRCYHPLKGFASALLGTVPFLLACLCLAFTAQLQTFSLGMLPSWLQTLERRPEIGEALAYYHEGIQMGFVDYVRVAVRIMVMPFVNMAGSGNAQAMLWVERLSPLLCLLSPAAFGLGYLKGYEARTQVHTHIAANTRKKKRQEKKKIAQRKAPKGPEQLI